MARTHATAAPPSPLLLFVLLLALSNCSSLGFRRVELGCGVV